MTVTAAQLVVFSDGDTEAVARTLESIANARRAGDSVTVIGPQNIERATRRFTRVAWSIRPPAREPGRALILMTTEVAMVGSRWLQQLVELSGPNRCVIPATNALGYPVSPLDAPTPAADRESLRSFARTLDDAHRGSTREVSDVSGPIVVAGPHAEVEPASPRELHGVAGHVALGVYGHSSRAPFLSACLIMKDEVDNLAECITALRSAVDEVVIYDTGSTDGSIELARSLGATVIEGYWDDDFSRARNASLSHCRGEWILHVDPDEVVEDPQTAGPALRRFLAERSRADAVAINIFNLEGSRLAPSRSLAPILTTRLFRRARCWWSGAIHEQPVARPGQSAAMYVQTDLFTLLHSGYLPEVITERNKRERNVRIASIEADTADNPSKARFDMARSLLLVNRHAEAVDIFAETAARSDQDIIIRSSLELGSQALLDLGRLEESAQWADRLAAVQPGSGVAALLLARVRSAEGKAAEALALIEGHTEFNDRFSNNPADGVEVFRGMARLSLSEPRIAAEHFMNATVLNPLSPGGWPGLAAALAADPQIDPGRALEALPTAQRNAVLGHLMTANPVGANRLAEAFLSRGEPLGVLAFASDLSLRLPVDAAMVWSKRLRAAGLAERCPLRQIADDETLPLAQRRQAQAGAIHFGDDDRRAEFEAFVAAVDDDELAALLAWVLDHATDAADSVIVAGATTASRAMTMVPLLADRGHLTEAVAVYGFAGQLGSSPLSALSEQLERELRAAAEQLGRRDVVALLDAH